MKKLLVVKFPINNIATDLIGGIPVATFASNNPLQYQIAPDFDGTQSLLGVCWEGQQWGLATTDSMGNPYVCHGILWGGNPVHF